MARWGWLTLIACVRLASAEPAHDRFEASGFVGVDDFSDNTRLGNSPLAGQIPGTSPVVGARVGYVALPSLWSRGETRLQLGGEVELALAPAYTGSSSDSGRPSYFAPVFEWHAHAMLRLASTTGWLHTVRPHVVLGGGGETVASSSPFMKETEPVAYVGLGFSAPVGAGWQVRIDVREGLMPARLGATTNTAELQFGVATTFGLPRRHIPGTRVELPPAVVATDTDSDGDGIPDRLDKCPNDPETVNGFEDADGCPEPDPDGDGLVGPDDKCPDAAEDFDHFQDEDGCPDPDNDRDGIADELDACPDAPETYNGFEDDDGCPDVVPPELVQAIDAAATVQFEAGRARLGDPAKRALAPLVAMLAAHHHVRIVTIGHPETAAAGDLARRRADAVKWYLIDQGLAADRIEARIGAVERTPAIHVELVVSPRAPPHDE